jgi:hypothetical protein
MYNDCELRSCLATAFEDLKNNDCNGDACEKYVALKEKLIRTVIMIAAANYDFQNQRYSEANNKLQAADVLCKTGICQYHYGC